MNKRGPALFLVTLISALFLLLIFFLYNSKEHERKARMQKETELSQKMSELLEKETELTDLKKQKEGTEQRLNNTLSGLETTLKKADESAKILSEKIQALTEEKEALKKELEAKASQIDELSDKITALERDKSDLLNNLKKLQAEKEAPLSEKIQKKQEKKSPDGPGAKILHSLDTIKLGKIVVQKSSGRPTEVTYVDKLYGFIVISAGTRDGLGKDSVVNIIRDNQLIGKAVVQKANKNLAAAILLSEWTQQDIQPGDLITQY